MRATAVKTDRAQLRRIFVCARDAGVDNDLLHLICKRETGKVSLKNLKEKEARQIIAVLLQNQVEKIESRPAWLCSAKQEWLIDKLEKQLRKMDFFTVGAKEFRASMLRDVAGATYRKELRHTMKNHAGTYIEILKSAIARRNTKARGTQ